MNKDNAKDYLPLVQALADGKKIQGFMDHSQKWEDMGGEIFFDGHPDNYRIRLTVVVIPLRAAGE